MPAGHAELLLGHLLEVVAPRGVAALSDRQLVERFTVERDEAAFEALVKRHGPLVLHVCRRVLGNEHDAEDAFQATFLVLSAKVASLRRQESVGSWLHGVAYRLALKLKAEASRRRNHEGRAVHHSAMTPLEQITVGEARAILDEELANLPEKYRLPLVLCCLEGLARDEAAQQLGWPASTLKSRLEEARERLRRRLGRRGLTIPAALLAALLAEGSAQALPVALVRSTVHGALVFAGGKVGASGMVSAKVAALAEEMLRTVFATRVKVAAALVLLLSVVATGAAFLAQNEREAGPANSVAAQAEAKGAIVPRRPMAREDRPRVAPGSKAQPVPQAHKGKVFTVAFSPDGSKVASGSEDGSVKLWESATAQEVLTIPCDPPRPVTSLAFSPVGSTLALGRDDGTVEVWDVVQRKRKARFQGSPGWVAAIAFSGDGKTVVSGRQDRDGTVEWDDWARPNGQPRATYATKWGSARCTGALSPDGKSIIWGMKDGGLTWWDLEKRKLGGLYPRRHQAPVTVVAFSPVGITVASGSDDGALKLWMLCAKEQATCRGHTGAVRAVAFTRDGKLMVTGGDDRALRFWDTGTGQQRAARAGHQGPVLAVAFSPDGRKVASGGADRTVKLWDRPPETVAP